MIDCQNAAYGKKKDGQGCILYLLWTFFDPPISLKREESPPLLAKMAVEVINPAFRLINVPAADYRQFPRSTLQTKRLSCRTCILIQHRCSM